LVAIEKVQTEEFDLVLMDIQLPEMDGYQATSYIRNKIPAPKSNVPIIAMTAHAFVEEIDKCKRYGMNDYISKPFDENRLQEKIIKVMQKGNQYKAEPAGKEVLQKNSSYLTHLEKAFRGDKNFIYKMISVFLDQTPGLLSSMKLSIYNRDKKLLKKVIHRMMPSVAFMEMKEMEEILNLLGKHAEEEKFPEDLLPIYQKAEQICKDAMGELKSEMEKIKK
jgi:response regulator RpfG family c-di-GMP phosphodiesterase